MTSPTPESTAAAAAPLPLVVRILSGIGGVLVFLVGLLVSLGAAVGTPVGIYLVRRWARRRERVPGSVATWFGAVAASAVVGLATCGVIFALLPRPTQAELDRAAAEQGSQPAAKLPAWYTKAFPQAERTDSATEQMMRSPGFVHVVFVMGAVIIGVFCGALGGSLGWCAALLLRVATARPPG